MSPGARSRLRQPSNETEVDSDAPTRSQASSATHDTVRAEYELEYGTDALELHTDAVAPGARVLVHDDLLATGGTAAALCDLVAAAGGEVAGCLFLIELAFLGGAAALAPHPVRALLRDAGE